MTYSNNTTDQRRGEPTGKTRIVITTDGSCLGNPGPGGWAAIIERETDGEVVKRLTISEPGLEGTTNNRMEMTAVIEALKRLKKNEPAPITVRSDLLLLVNGMNGWLEGWQANDWKKSSRKPVKNRDLWEELLRMSEGKLIEWVWIKGHAGDLRNERVDLLARRAAEQARWKDS